MEQMPHHREGIQEQLDKAYDEGHRDNEAMKEAKAKIAEIKGKTGETEREFVSSPELRSKPLSCFHLTTTTTKFA